MSTWEYRVTVDRSGDEPVYAVREVYYSIDGILDGVSWTADPVYPQGETLDEFQRDLAHYAAAADKPVIDITPPGA